jgi:hypothetical protein
MLNCPFFLNLRSQFSNYAHSLGLWRHDIWIFPYVMSLQLYYKDKTPKQGRSIHGVVPACHFQIVSVIFNMGWDRISTWDEAGFQLGTLGSPRYKEVQLCFAGSLVLLKIVNIREPFCGNSKILWNSWRISKIFPKPYFLTLLRLKRCKSSFKDCWLILVWY